MNTPQISSPPILGDTLTVPARFCGPPRSGNGGWTAGALADRLPGGTISVRLNMPPPLDVPMQVTTDGAEAVAIHQGESVATAQIVSQAISPVPGVDLETARAAEATYPGLSFHPFPTCFVCGTGRDVGDGLRVFPGQVADTDAGRTRVAASWTPHPSFADGDVASVAITWAAMDCIGGWAGDLTERLMVLGTMTAAIGLTPPIGEPHVLVAENRGSQGRRTSTAVTLYEQTGRAIAVAEHIWIAVDVADFS